MSTMAETHYEILGVSRQATTQEIKTAYRELAKSLHPDKNKFGASLFKRVNEAHAVLADPAARAAYDRGPSTPSPQPSPPPGQAKNEKDGGKTESDEKLKQTILKAGACLICKQPVHKNHAETKCCGRLCCVDCKTSSRPKKCPNKECKNRKRLYWRDSSSKITNVLLDEIAQSCRCGKRFLKVDNYTAHKKECPSLNTKCFKCSGHGCYRLRGKVKQCDACNGRKILSGLNWRQCFKCQGKGAFEGAPNTFFECKTCLGKGGLHGLWTMCFKCQGKGGFGAVGLGRVACDACACAGAFKGLNRKECPLCAGCACEFCKYKGSVKCSCGPSCKGHSHEATPRSRGREWSSDDETNSDFDSDSS